MALFYCLKIRFLFLAPQSVLIEPDAYLASARLKSILFMDVYARCALCHCLVCRFTTVDRRARPERHLMDAYEQISRAQVEKDRYAVLMTHQLKAPLDAIRSKISLIKGDYCGEASPEIMNVIMKVDDRAAGMAGLILDVLKLERLKAAARDPANLTWASILLVFSRSVSINYNLLPIRIISISSRRSKILSWNVSPISLKYSSRI